jgi:hypothetical protein
LIFGKLLFNKTQDLSYEERVSQKKIFSCGEIQPTSGVFSLEEKNDEQAFEHFPQKILTLTLHEAS